MSVVLYKITPARFFGSALICLAGMCMLTKQEHDVKTTAVHSAAGTFCTGLVSV